MDESNTLKVIVLGRAGSGKSSLANTILGKELFQINHTARSGRSKCQAETKSVKRRSITLIEAPGFFDSGITEGDLKHELSNCIKACAPGPHAFLVVLKMEKFTVQEQAVFNKVEEYFSEEVFKYATVVFTHGDQLDEGQTAEEFVHHDKSLDELVKRCGGRCHVVDNKYWKKNPSDNYRSNQFAVEKILNTLEKTVETNKGSCYNNETPQALEPEVSQSETTGLLVVNMPEEDVRKEADRRESVKIWKKLIGVTIGIILAAAFCIAVSVLVRQVFSIGAGVFAEPAEAGMSFGNTFWFAVVGAVLGGVTGYYACG